MQRTDKSFYEEYMPGYSGIVADAQALIAAEKYIEAEEVLQDRYHSLFTSSVTAFTEDPHFVARLYCRIQVLLGKHDEALRCMKEIEAAPWYIPHDVRLILMRGWALLAYGRYHDCMDLIQRLKKGQRAAFDDSFNLALLLHLRGRLFFFKGHASRSRRDLRDALAIFRQIGERLGMAVCYSALAITERTSFNIADARHANTLAMDLFAELGLTSRIIGSLMDLAVIEYKSGNILDSMEAVNNARRMQYSYKAKEFSSGLDIMQARCLVALGRPDDAIDVLQPWMERIDDIPNVRQQALILETIAEVQCARNNTQSARMYLSRATDVIGEMSESGEMISGILRRQAQAHLQDGDHVGASALLKDSLSKARKCAERYEVAITKMMLGECSLASCYYRDAYGYARGAYDEFRDMAARHQAAKAALLCAKIRYEWHQYCATARQTDFIAAEVMEKNDRAAVGVPWLAHVEAAWGYLLEASAFFVSDCFQEKQECDHLSQQLSVLQHSRWVSELVTHDDETNCALVGNKPFIASAPSMKKLQTMVEIASSTIEPVLITGETGTGKELVARMVHEKGERAEAPFVPVNCAAIPETLFEREFFGHAKGAYTGAEIAKPGLCEEADGGTLFLDEIGDMPSYLQVKLLRLLQEGTYRRLGDPEERHVDLRIIAATNAPLPELIAESRFRQDLYYRLQTLEMQIPPLRERPEDLLALMALFIERAIGEAVPPAKLFDRKVMAVFKRYPWPGNVRELEAMTRRMALLARHNGKATGDMLPQQLRPWLDRRNKDRGSLSLNAHLAAAERERIGHALVLNSGNRSEAARALGVSRNQLYRRMEKLGIQSPK